MTDCWADWLRVRRSGGSSEERRATLERLAPIRDRILDDAQVRPGELTLLAEITTEPMFQTRDWRVFLDSSPNPLAPTFGEAMQAALTAEEAERLTAVLRPQVEAGRGTTRMARAFLNARRPA